MSTLVAVEYDCRYEQPARIPDTGSALRHASAVDTVTDLIDALHDRECPTIAVVTS